MAGTLIVLLLAIIALLIAILRALIADSVPELPPTAGPGVTCDHVLRGPDDFEGDWDEQSYNAALGGSSTFNGTIALSNVGRDVVDDVLPPDWRLAEQTSGDGECHPVLIVFGHQTDLGAFVLKNVIKDIGDSNDEYREMMVLIPFVQSYDGNSLSTKLHTFVVRMFLDDALAERIGNDYYGYAKELAEFTESTSPPSAEFTVLQESYPVLYAETTGTGSWEDFTMSSHPMLQTIVTILEMPLVGKIEHPVATGGAYNQCSYFELEYVHADDTEARVRSAEVGHEYLKPFAANSSAWMSLGTVESVQNGAIEITDLSWRVSFPPQPYCVYN